MKVNSLISLGAAVLFTACSSTDLFEPNAVENATKSDYAANFVKKYAGVDMNQSWDYSTKQPDYRLGGSAAKAETRAAGDPFSYSEDYYTVDNNTLKWMNENLKEEKNNKEKGNPFYITAPGNDFTIIPIHSNANAVWDLHVVVDGTDYPVWKKHQGMQVIPKNGSDWVDISTVGKTIDAKGVRCKEIKFSGVPLGAEIYFYLEVLKGGVNGWVANSAKQSSLNHMMLALQDVPRPANIPEEKEVMIIGCEDADQIHSDWDMNDLVLLLYGDNKLPKPIDITNEHVEEVTTVRYMVEDLGATDDFDFNDIVLDVSNIVEKTAVYENGKFKEWTDVSTRQEATIRHLGGTLPFTLKIGDTQLEEMQGQLGANPNTKFNVTGWDMTRHNISIQVRQLNNEGVNTIGFPKKGEAPMIIAVDPTQEWMSERTSVPADWFTVPE